MDKNNFCLSGFVVEIHFNVNQKRNFSYIARL